MGRKRQDRTIEEWTEHGGILLDIIGKKHKLYKTIKTTRSTLINESDETIKQELIKKLNSHKDNLGEHWLTWTKKIKQKPKDENRSKFYIEKNAYDGILRFIGLSKKTKKLKEISDNQVFKTLFEYLNAFEVNNVGEMHDLIDELNKFNSATSDRYSKDKLSEIKVYHGITNNIIHAILSELKRNKISNFEKLISIKKDIKNEKIDELEIEITRLKKIINSLKNSQDDKLELDDLI
jgi:hypothetical protein